MKHDAKVKLFCCSYWSDSVTKFQCRIVLCDTIGYVVQFLSTPRHGFYELDEVNFWCLGSLFKKDEAFDNCNSKENSTIHRCKFASPVIRRPIKHHCLLSFTPFRKATVSYGSEADGTAWIVSGIHAVDCARLQAPFEALGNLVSNQGHQRSLSNKEHNAKFWFGLSSHDIRSVFFAKKRLKVTPRKL